MFTEDSKFQEEPYPTYSIGCPCGTDIYPHLIDTVIGPGGHDILLILNCPGCEETFDFIFTKKT